MKLASKAKAIVGKFIKNKAGNVMITTALVMPVLLTAAGAAMDYSRMVKKRSNMTNALDAAVLYSGNDLTQGKPVNAEFRKRFEDFLFANLESGKADRSDYTITKFTADPQSGEVSAKIETNIGAGLMRIAGFEDYTIESTSSSIFSQSEVEVSVMLDVTGSMRGRRIADLKVAATDLVNILLPDANTRNTRISLIPYAGSVNAGKYAKRVTANGAAQIAAAQKSGALLATDIHGARNTCVTERGGIYAATDASYKQAPIGNDVRTQLRSNTCPQSSEIEPLTNNRGQLLNKINGLSTAGWTAGHLGIAWSYYTLSENWRDLWNSDNDPSAYNSGTKKIAILMTDGGFNTYYYGTPGTPSESVQMTSRSNNLARALCEDMKAPKGVGDGIKVYSIAFQAPVSAQKTLRACANEDTSETTFYYNANNGQELREAFREIADSISNLRIKN